MKCEEVKLELPGLLFGELSESERERLLSHISKCDGCRREWNELKSTEAVMMELGEEEPPADMVFIAKESEKVWKKALDWLFAPGGVRWGFAAAMVLVALWVAKPNISYKEGGFSLSFGRIEPVETIASAAIEKQLQADRLETLRLVSQMLAENSENQQREYNLALASLARDLDLRRHDDLRWMETSLTDIQRNSHAAFRQNNMMIEDLIKNASFSGSNVRRR